MSNALSMLDRPILLTAFDYMYRDAGNFKARGSILLSGRLSGREKSRILDALEAEEFFIAEQVNIPPVYEKLFRYSGGRTPLDHAWHSFCAFRELEFSNARAQLIWGPASDLVTAFEQVTEWNLYLSLNVTI